MYRCHVTTLALMLIAASCQELIPGEYFIGLRSDAEEESLTELLEAKFYIKLKKRWNTPSTKLLYVTGDQRNVSLVSRLPDVKFVDYNAVVRIEQQCVEQPSPGTWGLDRIDQRSTLPYSDPTNPDATYAWGERNGAGVSVYVLDTGIDVNHTEFDGRALWGYTADQMVGTEDDNGHGTFCAGIVGSRSYGVAKEADLVAVKVLDKNGLSAWNIVIDGMVWVLERHQAGDKSIVSMSLGAFGTNAAVEEMVEELYQAGVNVIVAAGNSYADACSYTPARAPNAITVAASDINDTSATFTNWGPCVDLFAPGIDVLSTYPEGASVVLSGTSAATPHAAGAVAAYLGSLDPTPTPAEVAAWLLANATADTLNWSREEHGSSPNLLLYVDC